MENVQLYNEREVLQQVAVGNKEAFEQLYRHYRGKAYAIALTMMSAPAEAEDILQECFLKLWKNREQLATVESFDNYLFIMLRNMLISALRRSDRQDKIRKYLAQTARLQPGHSSELEKAEAGELSRAIAQIIAALPDKQQRIYRLSREAGLSHEEIARAFQLSARTVSNTITLVNNRLKDALREQGYLLMILVVFLQTCHPFGVLWNILY